MTSTWDDYDGYYLPAGLPAGLPDLISGAGDSPEEGGCVMQAAAWLASNGEQWTDAPACVHRVLRRVAINVNDSVSTATRRQLWPLIPRLLGTASGDRKADIRTGIALAVWAAERVLPLIRDTQRHETAAGRIAKARGWLASEREPAAADAAAAAADAAAAAAAAAYADAADADAYADAAAYAYAAAADAYDAADAAADAAADDAYDAAAAADAYDAAYAAAADAADAAASYAYAAAAADADRQQARVGFLVDLLDEYDRVTGRAAPAQIAPERWEGLCAALTHK